jgi:glycerol-3-phosphate dehydrogenase (NAD(P)+)
MSDVAVIGAGAWGTALAIQAARAGGRVVLWARDPARAALIQATRENPRLPGHRLPDDIAVTFRLPAADLVVLAVPLQHLRGVALELPPGGPLLCCAKGVEAATLCLPLELLEQAQPGRAAGVLTGPNFANEVASGLPAASVVAAVSEGFRREVMAALSTRNFRLYGSDDPIGAQAGGAAKNVVAIAAGAAMGAGLGENARAALITRGLAEIGRFAVALGGRAETVAGLSGLGDLLLTCTGPSSRNFSLGVELGRGATLQSILAGRSTVAEGVATAAALVARAARLGVEMPVCAAVASVLDGSHTVADAVQRLLGRGQRDESPGRY